MQHRIARCLSVSQPFADLIVSGKKTIDLRWWNTRYRGDLMIHAPLRIIRDEARRLGIKHDMTTGAIVGMVELYDVKRYNTKREINADAAQHLAARDIPGKRYGFLLRGARVLRIPIPCKGRLGIFTASLPRYDTSRDALKAEIIDEEYRYQWIGHH